MSQYTKGPWNSTRAGASMYDIICAENEPKDICVVSKRGKSMDEVDANTKLIAAAPGLLEALQALLHSEWQDDEGHPRLTEARNKARAAIQKATS